MMRHEDSDTESERSYKSASSLLSRRSANRSSLSICSDKGEGKGEAKSYRDLLYNKGYHITGILGRGQNSGFVVHSAMKDGQKFAVKVSTENAQEGTNGEVLRREFAVLSKLKHENIVQAFSMWQGDADDGTRGAAMVLELCKGSTLNRVLPWSQVSFFDMECRRKTLLQIANAVSYLHELGLSHCDLHSKNVVVDAACEDGLYRSDSVLTKVIDFGCARTLKEEMSVEADINVNILPVGSTQPCDIFALGLIGCSLIAGKEISSWSVVPNSGNGSSICLPKCALADWELSKEGKEYLHALLAESSTRFSASEAFRWLPEGGLWLVRTSKLSL